MNPDFQSEIQQLKKEIEQATSVLASLSTRLEKLEIQHPEVTVKKDAREIPLAIPASPGIHPQPLWLANSSTHPQAGGASAEPMHTPPLPPPPPPRPVVAKPPLHHKSPTPPAADGGIEWRLGTYWLVRIGIVMLLTGVVFLGNFVWKNYIPHFGPWGKLAAFTGLSTMLIALGTWLERKKADLQNYGRVLLAGGLALGYYTAYAAHFVEKLRVLESPVAGGSLLLLAAGAVAWFADRRKAESVAILAVLLSFYTAVINPIAEFSLFSNAILCLMAIFFLVRKQWEGLTWITLVGSYAAFGFWRFYQSSGQFVWGTGLAPEEFWKSRAFLLTYWILFTVAFLLRNQVFSAAKRAWGLSVNNSAFFAFTAPSLYKLYPDQFWMFPLIFGAITFGMTVLVSRRHAGEDQVEGSLLFQSLAFLVLGFGAKLHGWQLSLALGLTGLLVLGVTPLRHKTLALASSFAIAFIAVLLATNSAEPQPNWSWNLIFLAAICLGNATILHRRFRSLDALSLTSLVYGFLLIMSLCVAVAFTHPEIYGGQEWTGVVVAAVGLGLFIFSKPLRQMETLFVAQFWLIAGAAITLKEKALMAAWHPDWLAAIFLGAAACWRRFCLEPDLVLRRVAEGAMMLIALAFAHSAVRPLVEDVPWIWIGSGSALVLAAIGTFWRSGGAFLGSLIFQISAAVTLINQWKTAYQIHGTVLSLLALGLLSQANFIRNRQRRHRLDGRMEIDELWPVAGGLWSAAQVLLINILWTMTIFSSDTLENWFFTIAVATAGICYVALPQLAARHFTGLWFVFLAGLTVFVKAASDHTLPMENLVGLLLAVALERIAAINKASIRPWLLGMLISLITAAFVIHVHLWMHQFHGSTTVGWAILAALLLALGFRARQQYWRIAGLCCFLLSLLRIITIDVWKLDTLGRILSFIILGIALLGIGFLYNHLKPRFREWTGESPP